MYYENEAFVKRNREIEDRLNVRPITLANGGHGVSIRAGNYPLIITKGGALKLATQIADTLQEMKGTS